MFVFKTGELLSDSWLGIVSAVTVMLATPVIDASSQLFPSIFVCAYLFATVFALLKYVQNPRSNFYLPLVLVAFFCAYGAKVTSLYFLPAILLYLRYVTSTWRASLLFIIGFSSLFALEAVIIAYSSGEFVVTGRLGYMGKHLGLMEDKRYEFAGLFKRWNQLPAYRYLLLLGALVISLFFARNWKRHKLIFLLVLLLTFYVLAMTYAVTSLKPLRLVEPVRLRYTLPTLPLTILICFYGLMRLGGRFLLATCLILIIYAQWPSYESRFKHSIRTRNYFYIDEFQAKVNQFYEDGYGMVFGGGRHARLYLSMYLYDSAVFCEKKKQCVDIDALPASELNVHDGPLYFYLIKKYDKVKKGYIVLSHHYELDKVFTLEQLEQRRKDAETSQISG